MISFNAYGLFPAPTQSEADFAKKIQWLNPQNLTPSTLPLMQQLDLNPAWVPMRHDRKGLSFWEGAALWEEQIAPNARIPTLQIPPHTYIPYDELLTHEMVHAARIDFHDHQFEEVLAYRTSAKRWRRYWGPFFRTPKETRVFLCLLALVLVGESISTSSGWLGIILATFIGGWIRLHCTHRCLERCLNNLKSTMPLPEKAEALLLRLSDEEIREFARLNLDQLAPAILSKNSWRWKLLRKIYW